MNVSRQTLQKLEKQYGDSFYILDIRKFENNYKEFLTSFREIYSNRNIGYCYQTNYTPKICQCVNFMCVYADVVSKYEFEFGIYIGIYTLRYILNCAFKYNKY